MLGKTVKDKVTGFYGIVTGKAEYLTGCAQYLLAPKVAENGSFIDGQWFDEGRLEVVGEGITKEEVSAEENGCDKQAPKK